MASPCRAWVPVPGHEDGVQISGERDAEKETRSETVYTYKREYGSFVRSFTLPDGADLDHAKSELKDGVLTPGSGPRLSGAERRRSRGPRA